MSVFTFLKSTLLNRPPLICFIAAMQYSQTFNRLATAVMTVEAELWRLLPDSRELNVKKHTLKPC